MCEGTHEIMVIMLRKSKNYSDKRNVKLLAKFKKAIILEVSMGFLIQGDRRMQDAKIVIVQAENHTLDMLDKWFSHRNYFTKTGYHLALHGCRNDSYCMVRWRASKIVQNESEE